MTAIPPALLLSQMRLGVNGCTSVFCIASPGSFPADPAPVFTPLRHAPERIMRRVFSIRTFCTGQSVPTNPCLAADMYGRSKREGGPRGVSFTAITWSFSLADRSLVPPRSSRLVAGGATFHTHMYSTFTFSFSVCKDRPEPVERWYRESPWMQGLGKGLGLLCFARPTRLVKRAPADDRLRAVHVRYVPGCAAASQRPCCVMRLAW